ncbi:MAG: aspartate aminotransferase family protein [Candidatus Paceibacterota bacterium]
MLETSDDNPIPSVGRDLPALDVTVADAFDSTIRDVTGRTYLDFTSGWCVGNFGWANPEIRDAVLAYKGPDYVYPSYQFQPWDELASLIGQLTPRELTHSFRATGGTEAVEFALQMSMSHTGRKKFVAIQESYHGHSLATLALGGGEFNSRYLGTCNGFLQLPLPLDRTAAIRLDELLKNGDVAAFIMEPVICNLGSALPTQEFMTCARESCTRYGTLFIADEVATGFMRTGEMFAFELFNIKPDIICLAKSITGGYGSLGVAVTTSSIARSMHYEMSTYSTFGWHPRSTIAAIATIRYMMRNRQELRQNVLDVASIFRKELPDTARYTLRAAGLAIALIFSEGADVSHIVRTTQKRGLLVSQLDSRTLSIFPALTISPEEALRGIRILQTTLHELGYASI